MATRAIRLSLWTLCNVAGNICLQVVTGTDRETLHGFILEKTVSVTEAMYTDEWPAYKSIADKDTKWPRQ